MRKFSLVVLVAALALPAASFAKSPPPHKAKSALQQLIAKTSSEVLQGTEDCEPDAETAR